jgi:hypothetical protein
MDLRSLLLLNNDDYNKDVSRSAQAKECRMSTLYIEHGAVTHMLVTVHAEAWKRSVSVETKLFYLLTFYI